MKMFRYPFVFAIAALILSSCSPSLSPFTQRLYNENSWTESELKQIQFYLSEDIVLRRGLKGMSSEITSGEIKIKDGRKVEEIVLRRGTPGVILFVPKDNRFAVSFEEGDKKFLMFGPNPKVNDRYVLLASEWKNQRGKVSYGGERYWVDASRGLSSLMVDVSRARNVSVRSRTAKGRRVSN